MNLVMASHISVNLADGGRMYEELQDNWQNNLNEIFTSENKRKGFLSSKNHSRYWIGRDPERSSSPTLKWMAHSGTEPTTWALLAPCSNAELISGSSTSRKPSPWWNEAIWFAVMWERDFLNMFPCWKKGASARYTGLNTSCFYHEHQVF